MRLSVVQRQLADHTDGAFERNEGHRRNVFGARHRQEGREGVVCRDVRHDRAGAPGVKRPRRMPFHRAATDLGHIAPRLASQGSAGIEQREGGSPYVQAGLDRIERGPEDVVQTFGRAYRPGQLQADRKRRRGSVRTGHVLCYYRVGTSDASPESDVRSARDRSSELRFRGGYG